MKRSLICLAVLATFSLGTQLPTLAAPVAAPVVDFNKVTSQLPRGVRPLHYDVSVTPNAKDAKFSGKASIKIEVSKASKSITLHALDMSFKNVSLVDSKGRKVGGEAKVEIDAKAQTATFSFGQEIAKGQYQLSMEYDGIIGTQAVGLFSLDYDADGSKKRALYTQFENSDARRFMPSWDEPVFKATFNLDVTIPSEHMAVSNMPALEKKDLGNGKTWVKFATSPKMSTYLLFLSVGDFERATIKAEGTEIGVVAKRGSLEQARYALDESAGVLRYLNDYFGVRYPLPKLDNVAAPGQSQFFSAMENWGAIFTFESSLLLDPKYSTQADKERVFVTAAHETAHQWFGDLVTMQWWDDLWLNEGFASWMENRIMQRLHPEWLPEFNAIGVRESAMGPDSMKTTHPVVQHIETVEQANQAFDTITYQKGEAVIRMLENYVGEDAWRKGVRAYMKKHAYSSTVTKDFFDAIEKAAGKPIKAIAKDFTEQPGVPMIRVDDVVCKNGKSIVSLSQLEFSRDEPNRPAKSWQVPVVAQVAGTKVYGRTLVVNGKGSLQLPACGTVVVNAGQNGYYRTMYAPAVFSNLAKNFSSLSAIDQVGALADSNATAIAGQQPVANFLDLASSTPDEASVHVWSAVAGRLSGYLGFLKGDEVRTKKFEQFARAKLTPVMNKLGWEAKAGEPEYLANFRAEMIGVMSGLEDPATLAEARRRFLAMDTDPNAAPASLRFLILAIVARNADETTWNALRERAQKEKSAMVKDSLYALLATAKNKDLAKRALDLALTDEPGATTSASMIRAVAGEHTDMTFDFAMANLAAVNAKVDATSRSRYFPGLAAGATNLAVIDKLQAYAKDNLDPSSRGEVERVIGGIKTRLKIREERAPAVKAWVDANVKN